MSKGILVKQTRGTSQTSDRQKATLKALGLRGIGSWIVRKDTRAIRGMLNQVQMWIDASLVDESEVQSLKAKRLNNKGYKLG